MSRRVVVVTGAAGFLGSALAVELGRRHAVVALDRREPARALLEATPGVVWERTDVADEGALRAVLEGAARELGPVDVVLHLAAFYHFGTRWLPEYERTNVRGTSNVVRCAVKVGARRLIFASSLAAMDPPPPGGLLTERSPTSESTPYGRSKSIGERLVQSASHRLPAVVLRIGGVFSDWCELPPLHSLIELWSSRSPLGRVIVGRGDTAIPYVHREDLVRLVLRCIDRSEHLGPHEVLLACQRGCVSHRDLFPLVRGPRARSISIPPPVAGVGLRVRRAVGLLTGNVPFEHPWMLRHVDRPWVADTATTQERLGWSCGDGLGVRDRIATMLEHREASRSEWDRRNRARNVREYAWPG